MFRILTGNLAFLIPGLIGIARLATPDAFAQVDRADILNLKCRTNADIRATAPFPASLAAECPLSHSGGNYLRDNQVAFDNFRITYNPFGDLAASEGNVSCAGAGCVGGAYESTRNSNFKNVRGTEGRRDFLDGTAVAGEDIIVHLPKGFDGPREEDDVRAGAAPSRDVIIMLHGGGGLGEAAQSQLANMKSIQDLQNGPVLLIPNSGNHVRLNTPKWAWDSWGSTCQTRDPALLGDASIVDFVDYPGQDQNFSYDDGLDKACTSDLKRLIQLADDLKNNNRWIRRIILAGFSSGGFMTTTVLCTYPDRFDGYAIFESGNLIGSPSQNLCGELGPSAAGYAAFLRSTLATATATPPSALVDAKRPIFQVCSDQDDACSKDLGAVWEIDPVSKASLAPITEDSIEVAAVDHTEMGRLRLGIALKYLPDPGDFDITLGEFAWRQVGLYLRSRTTGGAAIPASAASLIKYGPSNPCSEINPAQRYSITAAYDASQCSFSDQSGAADDLTFISTLPEGLVAGETAAFGDIEAFRYSEKSAPGNAYGAIEVHGGGHGAHGMGTSNVYGKTKDFDNFVEMAKFMRWAY